MSNTVPQPCAPTYLLDFHKGPKRQGLSSCPLLRWEESGVTLSRDNSCCSWNWSMNSLHNSRITVHVQHSMRITVCRISLMLVTSLQIIPKWRTEICVHTERANHLCCAKLEWKSPVTFPLFKIRNTLKTIKKPLIIWPGYNCSYLALLMNWNSGWSCRSSAMLLSLAVASAKLPGAKPRQVIGRAPLLVFPPTVCQSVYPKSSSLLIRMQK